MMCLAGFLPLINVKTEIEPLKYARLSGLYGHKYRRKYRSRRRTYDVMGNGNLDFSRVLHETRLKSRFP